MDANNAIVVFQGRNVRRTWHNNEWWFSILDIVAILTDSSDPKQYVKKMRSRDPVLNSNWGTICTLLEIRAPDGKMRVINCVNTEGAFRVIQSIHSFKAEPFKLWLAKVGYDRVKEITHKFPACRYKKIVLNCLLLALSIFVAVVVLELIVQLTVPVSYHYLEFSEDFGHTFIKNLSVMNKKVKYVNYSVEIKTDSQGFRNEEVPYKKGIDTKRVMVLGDSITASVGVPADKMYTSILSKNLNNLGVGRWEVLNRGIEDWGTDNEYIYFVKEGYKYKPDIVILQFIYNDFSGVILSDTTRVVNGKLIVEEKFLRQSAFKKLLLFLNGKSGLYRLVAEVYELFNSKARKQFIFFSKGTFGGFPSALNETLLLITKLEEQVKNNKGVFFVLVVPDHRIMNKEHYIFWNNTIFKNFLPQEELRKIINTFKTRLEKNKIDYVDASFINESSDFIALNDGHFSIQGSKKLENIIYKKITTLKTS